MTVLVFWLLHLLLLLLSLLLLRLLAVFVAVIIFLQLYCMTGTVSRRCVLLRWRLKSAVGGGGTGSLHTLQAVQVQGLLFRVQGLGFLGFRVFRVWGFWGSRFRL